LVIDCIIPARAGSKSIPKKNISLLGGHPLLAYSIAAAKLSTKINSIYVSTDSDEFAGIARKYGAKALYLRPKKLSEDDSMDIDFFKYHIDFSKKNKIELPDLFVSLRPTTPLRERHLIDEAIENFITDHNSQSLRSAHKINLSPYKMFKQNGKYMKPFLVKDSIKESHSAARQLFEDTFIGNGLIDIIDPKLIEAQNLLYGNNIFLYETDIVSDIDGYEDLNDTKQSVSNKKFLHLIDYLNRFKNS
jgi:CMP-N,N'-diacetyllegionaminic acid synthase